MSMVRFITSKRPQGGWGQFVGRRSVASEGVVQTTVTVELSPWALQVHCPGESGPAGRDRDPVADTPTSNRHHPNRTRLRQIPSPPGGDRLYEHRNR